MKNWTFRRIKNFGGIVAKQWNFVINGVSLLIIWDSTNRPEYQWEVETLKAGIRENNDIFVKGYGKTRAAAFKDYKDTLKRYKEKLRQSNN